MNFPVFTNVLMSTLSIASVSLLICSPKKVTAQEYPGCFMTNELGQRIDLSYVCGGEKAQHYSLKEKFFYSIKKLGIPIVNENCRPGLMGSYQPGKNKMILCQNNIKSDDLYIETLAHESWHIIQDCVGNLDDSEVVPVTTGNFPLFKSILSSLNSSDISNLSLYDSEKLPYEVEAFAMEKHPDVVLKGLDACASRYLSQK